MMINLITFEGSVSRETWPNFSPFFLISGFFIFSRAQKAKRLERGKNWIKNII